MGARPLPGPPNYIGIFDDARSHFRIVYDWMRRYPIKMPHVRARAAKALVIVAALAQAPAVLAQAPAATISGGAARSPPAPAPPLPAPRKRGRRHAVSAPT